MNFPKTAQIVCEFWFEASHVLTRPDWTEDRNRDVFGKCVRLHGHSYRLLIWLRGRVDAETGMVVNFRDVKGLVRERVLARLDHRHLNDVMEDLPTAENIAHWIAAEVAPALTGAELTRLELWETKSAGAILGPEELAPPDAQG